MTMPEKTITRNDLHAYVDAELNEERRRNVETWLTKHPTDASDVAEWQRQKLALRTLYDPVASELVPARLQVHGFACGAGRISSAWPRYLAATLFLTLGLASGWYARDHYSGRSPESGTLVAEAVEAHRLFTAEVVHPVEVGADNVGHLRSWLSKRLDRTLTIPDLRTQGLTLVGGRLLPATEGPAAQLMYETPSGQRLTFYIVPTPEAEETAFLHTDVAGLDAFYWRDETISCAVVADMPQAKLKAIATAAYKQLS